VKTSKKAVIVKSAKVSAKPARKLMSHAQRSAAAQQAAFKAWEHKTFQKITARAAKTADVPLKQYVRERNAARKAA
jgi:hypothetical protein